MIHPDEPSAEQCSAGAPVTFDGISGFACWYPQMGGYRSTAVVVPADGAEPGTCFDVYVWHDGDFPFDDGTCPRRLHHCEAAQFRAFADDVEAGLRRLAAPPGDQVR
jgi:hypothetical protein